jgi:hypothetical protein
MKAGRLGMRAPDWTNIEIKASWNKQAFHAMLHTPDQHLLYCRNAVLTSSMHASYVVGMNPCTVTCRHKSLHTSTLLPTQRSCSTYAAGTASSADQCLPHAALTYLLQDVAHQVERGKWQHPAPHSGAGLTGLAASRAAVQQPGRPSPSVPRLLGRPLSVREGGRA